MRTIRRGLRALVRSPLRASLLVGVLGVSIGLALIMITVNGAFEKRIDDIKGQVGTSVTVRPAGSFGGAFGFAIPIGGDGSQDGGPITIDGGGTDDGSENAQPTLADDDIEALATIDNVAGIASRITATYSGDEIESGFTPPEGAPAGFSPPIIVTGTDNPNALTILGGSEVTITSGRTFETDEGDADVAVIGESIATANDFVVGDTFTMNEATIEIVGIYSTGTQFGDNSIFMPLKTTQRLFDREGVDEVTVQADSVEHVGSVADDIRATLGEDVVDVTTQEGIFDAIAAPISDAKDSSRVGMIAALVASAAVILFSVGLVARQRVREIGILKAIGASRWQVISQFGIETVVVAVVAALIGAAATFPLAQGVADTLVSDTSTGGPTFTVGGPGGPPPGGGGFIGSAGDSIEVVDGPGAASGFLGDVDVAVEPQIFGYALAIAIVLALMATVVPAAYVGRVRPAEVLRNE